MALQLIENEWDLMIDDIFTPDKIHFLGNFVSPFVTVLIQSFDIEPGWRKAGAIAQRVPFQDTDTFGEFQQLKLSELTLLEFPFLTGNNYSLYYFPLQRLAQVRLQLWEYLGEIRNKETEELITAIEREVTVQADTSELQMAIEEMKQTIEEWDCPSNYSLNDNETQSESLDRQSRNHLAFLLGFI